MKLSALLLLACACAGLGGCVVVPAHGYYVRPHAVVVAPVPYLEVRPYR